MRKRVAIASILATIITLSVVGCNKGSTSIKSEDELKGTINVWSTEASSKSLRIAGENFSKKYKQVKVIVNEMQSKELNEKLIQNLLSDENLPDIVSIDSGRVSSIVNKFPNEFLDLTNELSPMKDKFLKSKLDEVTVKGKIMALPFEAAPVALFYRRDIFENAGIIAENIKTWQDYIEAGKTIYKSSNGEIKMLGFQDQNDDFFYKLLLNQLGTWYFDKEGKPIISSANSIKAMSMLKEIYDSKITLNCQDFNSIILAAQTGKIATVPYETSFTGDLIEKCAPLKGKWAVMKLPAFEPGGKTAATLNSTTIMVTSVVENKKLFTEFAKFSATDTDTLLTCIDNNSLFPSYLPIYSDLLFQTPKDYFGDQKVWRLFSIIAKDSISRDFTENFMQIDEDIKKVEVNILKGEDLKKAMDDAELNALNAFTK